MKLTVFIEQHQCLCHCLWWAGPIKTSNQSLSADCTFIVFGPTDKDTANVVFEPQHCVNF